MTWSELSKFALEETPQAGQQSAAEPASNTHKWSLPFPVEVPRYPVMLPERLSEGNSFCIFVVDCRD